MKYLKIYLSMLLLISSVVVMAPQMVVSDTASGKAEEEALPVRADNAPLEVEIWGGIRDLYSIAVPKPLGSEQAASTVKEVLGRNLTLSSLFKVLDSKSFLADLEEEGMSIKKDPWLQVGAQGVSKGQITQTGDTVTLNFALFEVARGETAVLQKRYTGSVSDIRSMVHKWTNEIINYFTGQPGAFGTRLAFARQTAKRAKNIFTADWTGGPLSRVSRNNSINVLPAFGPGGSIYYTSYMNEFPWLYRSGQSKPVLSYRGLNMGATFHGDKMAVVLSKDGNPEIYLGNADGSNLKRLTTSGSIDVSPSFSPDGSQIAFVSDRHGSPQIFVMDTSGGGVRRVTFKGSYNQTPSWCPRPGSNLIAFTGRDSGTFDVFTVDIGSKQIRRLTQNQGRNLDPAFSPDCRQVAFYSSRGGIFVSNPEGLNHQKVINGQAEAIRWSR